MTGDRFVDWAGLEPETARPEYFGALVSVTVALDDRLSLFAHRGRTDAELEWWEEHHRRAAEEGDEPAADPEPLAGLGYVAKDLLHVPGRAPNCGFARVPKGLAAGSPDGGPADLLRAFEGVGAERLGMARMTALAYEPSGWNPAGPQPLNPWSPEHITGGSSSGSGAAVAAGAAVLAIGSDTAGSVRIPAACCGITGWKPTAGLLPLDGALRLCPSLDTLGLLARHASEIETVARAILGDHGERRPTARNGQSELHRWPNPRLVAPPARVIVLADLIAAAEPSVARALRDGLDALEAIGTRIERKEGRRALDVLDKPTLALLQGESARTHRGLLAGASVENGLEANLTRRLEKGLAVADEDLTHHRRRKARLLRDFLDAFLPEETVLALPVLAVRTPNWAECDPRSASFSPRTLYALIACTGFVNYLGLPAVSVPVGPDDRGLPVGLQLVGRPGSDASLLAAAAAMQRLTDWHARVPPLAREVVTGTALVEA